MKTKKQQTPQQIITQSLILLIISTVAIILINEPPYLRYLFIPPIILNGWRLITTLINQNKTASEAKDKALERAFYDKCLEFKLTSVSSATEIAKAKTIAESLGVPAEHLEDIGAYFNKIKAELADEQEKERLNAENEQRAIEKQKHAELTRFAGYDGKEKRIAMLEAQRVEYLQKAALCRKNYNTGSRIGQQKEIDWATRGGIVSGIAGGAAGVAAAIDAQNKNEQIRQSNKQNMQMMMPYLSDQLSKAIQYEKNAKINIKYIEQTKTKIVNRKPNEELMRNLVVKDPKITVSSTGAISLKAMVAAREPVMILDVTKGCIDGTIIAQFYDGSKLVGEADLVLPMWGVSTGAWPVEGICLSGGKQGVNYRVEYKARNLWEIEGQQLIFKLD